MNLSISGLPAIALAVGFIVLFAVPVWLAAKVVGAYNATLLRSALALVLGTLLAGASSIVGGVATWLLVPLSFLLAFKFLLGATLVEAFLLGVISLIGGAFMVKVFGGAIVATFGGGQSV